MKKQAFAGMITPNTVGISDFTIIDLCLTD